MKRFVIIGTGGRGTESYAATLLREFPDTIELAGLYDLNPKRAEAANLILGTRIPVFASAAAICTKSRSIFETRAARCSTFCSTGTHGSIPMMSMNTSRRTGPLRFPDLCSGASM